MDHGAVTANFAAYVALLVPDATITCWSAASGGAQYTDLLDLTGTPVTQVDSDSSGQIPQFRGPDGVRSMWADAGGGSRRLMIATDLGDDIRSLAADQESLQDGLDNLSGLTDLMPVIVTYEESTSTWPGRPDLAGSRRVIWMGPQSIPPAGGMRTNDVFIGWP